MSNENKNELWDSKIEDIKKGYIERDEDYKCLICNEVSHVIGSNQQDDRIANILSTITSAIGVAGAFGIDVGQFVGNAIGSATSLINGVR